MTQTATVPARPFRPAKRLVLLGLAAVLVLSAPGSALAGKPGGSTSGTATVVASPNPVAVYQTLAISGSGYRPVTQLQVQISTSSSVGYVYAASDGSGNFSLLTSISKVGTATISVWQSGGRRATKMATTTVTVQ